MKDWNITIRIKRHEGALIAFAVFIVLFYAGEAWSDQGSCSKKNPSIDCSTKGTIDISQISKYNFTQTTGFGTHYVSTVTPNGTTIISPVPEFRGKQITNIYGDYMHVVCDLGNSTCEWHLDKYPALDFPFGTILHLSDALNFYVGLFSEDVWQGILWLIIVVLFYFVAREIEKRL